MAVQISGSMLYTWLTVVVLVQGAQFLVYASTPSATAGNGFSVVKNFATYQVIAGLPTIMALALFAFTFIPAFIMLASFLFSMFGSELGAAAALIIGAVTVLTGLAVFS